MSKKERKPHLGRGLEALLGPISTDFKEIETPVEKKEEVLKLPADKPVKDAVQVIELSNIVANPYQPRTEWDEGDLQELTDSIKANGVIQPILVRKAGAKYQIIAGERRFRASMNAGLKNVPALVRQASDEEMLELALVENIHRSDLNPIERANAYQHYISTFDVTQVEAAQRLGENRSVISNYLRLLDLPREVKEMLKSNQLSMGHARAILALPTDELRNKLANRAMAGRLSVREVEKLVRRMIRGTDSVKPLEKYKPSHILDLENRLRESLGTKVRIDTHKKGDKGKIIIEFYSLDEFDKLAERIGLPENEN